MLFRSESVYEAYYAFREPVNAIAAHRILAINRGEKEKLLHVKITLPTETVLPLLTAHVIRQKNEVADLLHAMLADAWKRAEQGGGWVEYNIINLVTGDVKGKASYVLPLDDQRLIGCGAYRSAVRSLDDIRRSNKAS